MCRGYFSRVCALRRKTSYWSQAARLDAEQKCAQAESLYQKALAAAPASPAVLNNFGTHYLACHSPAKAQVMFERLLRLKPGHTNARLQLARLALERNDGGQALRYLTGIDARDANDPEIALVRAEALAVSGDRNAAVSLMRRIGKSSSDPRILYALGLMAAHRGFYPEAEDAFGGVLKQVPNDFDVLFNLGLASAHCGHYQKARESFELALKAKAGDTDTLYELGRVETSLGDYDRAVYMLAQAAKIAPERTEIQLALARATQMGGYYGDSIQAYDRYLAAHPDDEIVERDRALVMGATHGGQSAALEFLRLYTAKHPRDAVGFYDLAQISYRANQRTGLAEVSRAVELDPHLQPALFFRAWVLNKAGRYEESLRDTIAALKLNPKDARALDLEGLNDLELNHPAEAEKPIREAIVLSPGEADFQFHLGRSLLEQGRRDEARPVLAEFQKIRQKWTPAPREEPGVIESATLSAQELAARVVREYKEAVRANPNEPALRLNLSRALLASGETDEALDSFRELLKMRPPAGLSFDAGAALLAAEQYSLACEFLRRSAAETPASNLDLATALYLSGDSQAALEALDKVPGDAQHGDSDLLRAVILNAEGRKAESLALLEAGAKRPLLNPRLAPQAATLLTDFGKASLALTFIERVQRSFPDDGPAALSRAAVLSKASRTEEALLEVRKAETRWPQWDRPYAAEALLLEKAGRPAEARARFDVASLLGPDDPVTECLSGRFRSNSTGAGCSCLVGIWSILTGNCH